MAYLKLKTIWISYRSFLPKLNFKRAWDEQNLAEMKWVGTDSLYIAFNVYVR